MIDRDKKYLVAETVVAWGSFVLLLVTYWLTVAPTVSFWDCPEYVSAAYLLEVGHPPGNPVWMLVERMVTLLVPGRYAALAVNLSSGLFTAFAAFFLAKTIFRAGLWVLLKLPECRIPAPLLAAGGALTGALAFGWCDSVWFSAVEAEVYAMSIFMTSLCVWLMTKWAGNNTRGESWRLLVLIAYLFGLSIGIHQLNLLCIPALAMIWAIRRGIRSYVRLFFILMLSCVLVGCILMGLMPSTIAMAAKFELFAVNRLNLPALWGVAGYILLLALSLLLALFAISRVGNRATMASACFPAILFSGIFIFSDHFIIGVAVSAIVSVLLVCGSNFKARRLYLSIWMLAMLLTGYSSYAIIPIRGSVASQANATMPGNPFAFAAYQSREQYGSTPLLYGPTPYSKPLLHEEIDSAGRASYNFYAINYEHPVYVPKVEGVRLRNSVRGLSQADSAENARLMAREGDAYLIRTMKGSHIKTPELNMWFPRITSSDPIDILSYGDWVGMDSSTMVSVNISEALDSAGNYVGKMDFDGRRRQSKGLRPTYMQNLQWFLMYQTSYMYWRYLLWNFVGRQNDRPSQGEVQHGNFITGFNVADNIMLGADDRLPDVAGNANKGRNRYFGLPLLLGLLGIIWLLRSERRGKQACFVIAVLFIMTGLAITVYLNQGPGEPRERDYSFLGSYLAFCVWIGFGAIMIARAARNVWGFAIPLAVAGWMCYENFDDHDRTGQYAAREFAASVLNSLERDAVIFVYGDNYTFPLWYAQEVEGIRTDVKVANLSYLSVNEYIGNLLSDWRDAKGIASVLKKEDILGDAYRLAKIPLWNSDTIAAVEALRLLSESKSAEFPSRYVSLRVSADSIMVYDLRNISISGGSTVDFGKLMMLDFVAANAASESPRPIYWMGILGADRRIGLTQATYPWIFGRRFGIVDAGVADSLIYDAAMKISAPNDLNRDVYMDHAPSVQVGVMRGSLVYAGEMLLKSGKIEEAVRVADRADILMGQGSDSYGHVIIEDSTFNVRGRLGNLLIECADSLDARISGKSFPADRFLKARVVELKARGRMHLNEMERRKKAWKDYQEALPPRLRNKMSPVY